MGDFEPQNGNLGIFKAEKWKFGEKIALETHFGTFWTICEKSIFLAQMYK